MDGTALARRVRADVAEEVAELGGVGLATVLVGDDPASEIYIRLKHKAAQEAGIRAIDKRLPSDAPQEDVLELVEELNADASIDGILVQTPVPRHLDEDALVGAVDPPKDVDCLTPVSAGRLYLGQDVIPPATPLGIMRLLQEYDVQVAGSHAVVVGRSAIVGKPMAHLLLQANATVTICHSRTSDLAAHTQTADVLVVAVGRRHLVTAEMVKAGAAVVDVGMNRSDDRLAGDVDPRVADRAALLSPVPGGVGPMTIAMLLQNTVRAARARRGVLAQPRA